VPVTPLPLGLLFKFICLRMGGRGDLVVNDMECDPPQWKILATPLMMMITLCRYVVESYGAFHLLQLRGKEAYYGMGVM